MTKAKFFTDATVSHGAGNTKASFDEAVRCFLLDCKIRNLSPYTIEGYHNYLKSFFLDLETWQLTWESVTLKDLSVRMVNGMLEKNYKPNTINGKIRTIQQFYKFLFEESMTETNLADGLKPIRNERKMIHTFTEDQLHRILAAPDQTTFTGLRDYTIMLLFLETGMRLIEMSNLKVTDLNFEENIINIQTGKGRKFRYVPIQARCVDSLKRYLNERGDQPFDQVWITVFDTPLLRTSIVKIIMEYMKQAKITGIKGACHIFRHTMAKLFLMNDGDIFTLQYLLGHANLEMTRYYIELFNSDIHRQHETYSPVENLACEIDFHGNEVQ